MPGAIAQPSQNKILSKLIARVEILERKVNHTDRPKPSGLYLLDVGGTAGFMPAGATTVIYGWDFTLPFDAYVIAEGTGAVSNSTVSSGVWSGFMEMLIDGFANDDNPTVDWYVPSAGSGQTLPFACSLYTFLTAGAHTLSLRGNTNGVTGSVGVNSFSAHLLGLPTATTAFEQVEEDFGC